MIHSLFPTDLYAPSKAAFAPRLPSHVFPPTPCQEQSQTTSPKPSTSPTQQRHDAAQDRLLLRLHHRHLPLGRALGPAQLGRGQGHDPQASRRPGQRDRRSSGSYPKPTLPPSPLKVHLLTQRPSQWYVEQIEDSKIFKLSAGSIYADPAPTIGKDGELCADISGGPATNWTLTGCETCGEGVFM